MIKFLVDECIHKDLTNSLKKNNLNILTAKKAGLSGKSDEEVFTSAQKLKRTLLTFDRGFGDIFRFNISSSHGVIILLISQMTKAEIVNIFSAFLDSFKNKDLKGKLVIIGKRKIRISTR